MHFLIRETLSFSLIYVAACYLVGTGMCHNMVGLLQHYYHKCHQRRLKRVCVFVQSRQGLAAH